MDTDIGRVATGNVRGCETIFVDADVADVADPTVESENSPTVECNVKLVGTQLT